jgi:Glycosyl hydrolase family 76
MEDSIRSAAGTVACEMMSLYEGNQSGQTPATLPLSPHYWWESGEMQGFTINYWHHTNDSTYNDIIESARSPSISKTWAIYCSNASGFRSRLAMDSIILARNYVNAKARCHGARPTVQTIAINFLQNRFWNWRRDVYVFDKSASTNCGIADGEMKLAEACRR